MPLFALFIGAILVVAAIRDTQGQLFSALSIDAPAYVTWGTAIVLIGSIGFVPGLKPISRGLLVLILVVLVLRNYSNVISGFNNAWQGAVKQGAGAKGQQPNHGVGSTPGAGNSDTGSGDVYVTPKTVSSITPSSAVAFNSFSGAFGVI